MAVERPNVEQILDGLKDFQKRTVEHAFQRLYCDPKASGRFLVADEVGLGKTMVAKGLIAKVVDHLWDQKDRIDIVYICSNADIARQNIRRLSLGETHRPELTRRITMLPESINDLQSSELNFISLTPGTSFDLKSSLGIVDERALIYVMLRDAWNFRGMLPIRMLQGDANRDTILHAIRRYDEKVECRKIDQNLWSDFIEDVNSAQYELPDGTSVPLRSRFEELMQHARRTDWQSRKERSDLVGRLRTILAVSCLRALKPDLIVLDEFQRFKHLFSADNDAGILAQHLFGDLEQKNLDTRLLLLSATPYKMYSLREETDDNHYVDFIDTLRFLYRDEAQTAHVESTIRAFRDQVYRLDAVHPSLDRLRSLKRDLEDSLKLVMARTERLSASEDRNGMLTQILDERPDMRPADVHDFLTLQRVAEELESGDVLEYWKTAPYLLNFMDDYKLKRVFSDSLEIEHKEQRLALALSRDTSLLFPAEDWRSYQRIDPRSAKLRGLMRDVVDEGQWRFLWLPPTMPYYQLSGPFQGVDTTKVTKRLIFSSWKVVPKVVAALVSYEAERNMMMGLPERIENTPEARRRRRSLLNFSVQDGRRTGMPVLAMMYPSRTLAETADPLTFLSHSEWDGLDPSDGYPLPTVQDILKRIGRRIDEAIKESFGPERRDSGQVDEAWYWAAPILLDYYRYPEETLRWWRRDNLATLWAQSVSAADSEDDNVEDTRWGDHVERVQKLLDEAVREQVELGGRPANLVDVLANLALGAPGVVTWRTLQRVVNSGRQGAEDVHEQASIMDAAAQIGWVFRSFFNVPEFTALIRGLMPEQPFWLSVIHYCVQGCLQSVLDEYVHSLRESKGLQKSEISDQLNEIVSSLKDAMTLKTTRMNADDLRVSDSTIATEKIRLRARYAQRFGDEESEGGQRTRSTQVRDAFNSPFWPFVLVTTSVGQEGLDFHTYCHSVMHWDLPSNPVDLEQREGRIHRYKGHVIRKNVALKYGLPRVLRAQGTDGQAGDLWEELFNLAARNSAGESELVPYWVFPLEQGAKVERHIPALPLSRDLEKLALLRRTLAVYRMVFGQPRQDELLEYLMSRLSPEEVVNVANELRVDLTPGFGA